MKDYGGIISINEPENDSMVYKIYSINKNDKSIYIGVTENYKERIKKHLSSINRKGTEYRAVYKWLKEVIHVKKSKVIFEIIEKELGKDEAFEKEKIYIKTYKDLGFEVLNLTDGGKGTSGKSPWNKGLENPYTPEQIQKLSDSHKGITSHQKGKKRSENSKKLIGEKNKERIGKEWNSPKRRNILKYNPEMELIAIYHSLLHASKFENAHPVTIGSWCRGEKNPRNGFIYKYENA